MGKHLLSIEISAYAEWSLVEVLEQSSSIHMNKDRCTTKGRHNITPFLESKMSSQTLSNKG